MTSSEKLEVARDAGAARRRRDRGWVSRCVARRLSRRPRDRGGRRGRVRSPGVPRASRRSCAALARASELDIDRAWEAVRVAARPRIHIFLATSDLHMEHKLRMIAREVLERVSAMVAHARALCDDVEFSAGGRDARGASRSSTRSSRPRSARGRRRSTFPTRSATRRPTRSPRSSPGSAPTCPAPTRSILSVHCHDDLGMATANTLAGLRAGARQAEVTINGIGERAGNASLEEVVMALRTRAPRFGLRDRDRRDPARSREQDRERMHGDERAGEQGDRRARTRSRTRAASIRTAC